MRDISPFYTKDGSVGLYSSADNDIYHSVYGAYSEAYDKFILPANFGEFLKNNKEIKILDICFGIGYNTKSFLNYFLENFSQKNFKYFNPLTENIAPIHTDNISNSTSNDSIYTNNILNKKNTINEINKISEEDDSNLENHVDEKLEHLKNGYNIKIDVVDTNEVLMKASALFNTRRKLFFNNKIGIKSVDKYLLQKSPNKHKYKMSVEANMIIAINLIEQYKDELFTNDVKSFLKDKKFKPFLSKNMLNFMRFYQNERYNLSSEENNLAFLHNIYYRYLSKSYKNTLKVLENHEISINCIRGDAREVVKNSLERYDFIFLDGFTASKAPSLWTVDFFKQLYQRLSYDGKLLTYSNSSAVRSAMLKSNFYIGKIFNENENKFTGTIAVKNPDLIEHSLDKYERGLLKTKAGIPFTDEFLTDSDKDIIYRRHKEVAESNLISSSQYIKNFKEIQNEL